MVQPYIGEIRMFGGNFAPVGWLFCQGQSLPISSYDVLFQLIGTTYGGDGQNSFNLPDLRSRLPIHQSSSLPRGTSSGAEQVTLTTQQAAHSHPLAASNDIPNQASPANNLTGQAAAKIYHAGSPSVSLNGGSISTAGGSQPHANIQPYLCVNFIIATDGIYPPPN